MNENEINAIQSYTVADQRVYYTVITFNPRVGGDPHEFAMETAKAWGFDGYQILGDWYYLTEHGNNLDIRLIGTDEAAVRDFVTNRTDIEDADDAIVGEDDEHDDSYLAYS
jgi:hypothetical protein